VIIFVMLLRTWESIVIDVIINNMNKSYAVRLYDRLYQQQLGFLMKLDRVYECCECTVKLRTYAGLLLALTRPLGR